MLQIEHVWNNKNKYHKLDLESEAIYTYVVICNPLISQKPVFHFSAQNSMRVCYSLNKETGLQSHIHPASLNTLKIIYSLCTVPSIFRPILLCHYDMLFSNSCI